MVKVLDDEKSFSVHYGGPAPPSAGNIWIVKGTYPSKLFLYDSNGILLNIVGIDIGLPWGIAVDKENDFLWISQNTTTNKVWKVDRVGNIIDAVVFTGTRRIWGIAEDNEHNFWLAYDPDDGSKIAKFDKAGNRLTDPFETDRDIYGLTFDPAGFLWMIVRGDNICKYSLDGNLLKTISFIEYSPYGIAMDADNYLWVNGRIMFVEARLWRMTQDGEIITSFPVNGDLYEELWPDPPQYSLNYRGLAVEPVTGVGI